LAQGGKKILGVESWLKLAKNKKNSNLHQLSRGSDVFLVQVDEKCSDELFFYGKFIISPKDWVVQISLP
jgi:hypothetical protein